MSAEDENADYLSLQTPSRQLPLWTADERAATRNGPWMELGVAVFGTLVVGATDEAQIVGEQEKVLKLVTLLIGTLSPVNHRGFRQG